MAVNDLQKLCHSLDKRIDEVIEKTGSGTWSKSKVQELLQKISVAAVLNKGDCGWIGEEDENLVQSTSVACIKKKRVFFKDPAVAEYLLATAVVNRLYNFAPSCAEIDGLCIGRILTCKNFVRLRCFLNWRVALVSITRNISKEATSLLKNLDVELINLAFLTIREEHLFHVDNMLSEAGLPNVIKNKKSIQNQGQQNFKKSFWAYFLSTIGLK